MIRWTFLLLTALSLSACATDYRGYGGVHHYDATPTYVGSASYYRPAAAARGDYYYGISYAASYHYPLWIDYPYYYSLFWPLQRGFYDPYWHPGFYYGVTYFPRNYFSISLYGGHRSYYRHYGHYGFAYSPYRLSWVDHYYDWYPYHRYYPRHASRWYAPRFGNPRHEAERLSRWTQARGDHRYAGGHRPGLRADGARDADYRGRTGARMDPGVRGFSRDEGLRQRVDRGAALTAGRDEGSHRAWRGGDEGRADGRARNESRAQVDRGRGADFDGSGRAWRGTDEGRADWRARNDSRVLVERGRDADFDGSAPGRSRDRGEPADARGWQRVERGELHARYQDRSEQRAPRQQVRGEDAAFARERGGADHARYSAAPSRWEGTRAGDERFAPAPQRAERGYPVDRGHAVDRGEYARRAERHDPSGGHARVGQVQPHAQSGWSGRAAASPRESRNPESHGHSRPAPMIDAPAARGTPAPYSSPRADHVRQAPVEAPRAAYGSGRGEPPAREAVRSEGRGERHGEGRDRPERGHGRR
jgi:hypothetical protein